MIVIKKYPNRRLYDTSKSQYINLSAIKRLVSDHKEFHVIDSTTKKDLTKNLLLQIVNEYENDESQGMLSPAVLKRLICLYGSDVSSAVRGSIDMALAAYVDAEGGEVAAQQEAFNAAANETSEANTSDWTGVVSEPSIASSDEGSREDY